MSVEVKHDNFDVKPPREFLVELKKVHPRLSVVFEKGLDRWVVWFKGNDGVDYRIWEVKNEDGSYRPLDQRTIDLLYRADMSRQIKDPSYIVAEQLQRRERYLEEQKAKYREEMRLKNREMKSQWVDAIDNASRGIVSDSQLYEKKIFSIPSTSVKLLQKLGAPRGVRQAVKL